MNKYKILLSQDKKLFHAADLALLWNIDNQDTLNMTLKRMVDKEVLHRIHKGFYATTNPNKIDPRLLGLNYINKYAYISLETILSIEGVIFQDVKYLTFISSRTQKFNILQHSYRVRKLKNEYLHNNVGIQEVDGYYRANLERAVADMLYYNPSYHFDNHDSIDFNLVKKYQKEIGYA